MEQDYEALSEMIATVFSGTTMIFCFILSVILIVAQWKIFTKAGEAGWLAIIPIVNAYTLAKIVYGEGLKFLLGIVPILQIGYIILMPIRLAQRFGKSTGWGVIFMLLLSPIGMLILGFGSDGYEGPDRSCFM